MGITGIASLVASMVVGGALGAVTLVGVVNSQTSPPSKSPASVESLQIAYGD